MSNDLICALCVFVDVRGFTKWSENVENFNYMDEFGLKLQKLIRDNFHDSSSIKYLGDGAMIIKQLNEIMPEEDNDFDMFLEDLITDVLQRIKKANHEFRIICDKLKKKKGTKIDLELGWGVTKGYIKKAGDEYIGPDLNKSARLCDLSRPCGIVIDKDDFPIIPDTIDIQLYGQKRYIKSFDLPLDVWVTKEISDQFLTREELKQTPEVHVAGICVKEVDGKLEILIAKRKRSRDIYPEKFEGCGGQITSNEIFTTGVRRHFKKEMNIDVEVIEDIHLFYYIPVNSNPKTKANIPGIFFMCKFIAGTPSSANHDNIKWLPFDDFKVMDEEDFIPNLKKETIELVNRYNLKIEKKPKKLRKN